MPDYLASGCFTSPSYANAAQTADHPCQSFHCYVNGIANAARPSLIPDSYFMLPGLSAKPRTVEGHRKRKPRSVVTYPGPE